MIGDPPLTIEIVLSRTERSSGCWFYTGAVSSGGYVSTSVNKKRVKWHRAVYEYFIGPIPEGFSIDHICHNKARETCPSGKLCRHRRCLNPSHLEAVPDTLNSLRGNAPHAENARKMVCKWGHPFDEINTMHLSSGNRRCRICYNAYQRRLYRAQRIRGTERHLRKSPEEIGTWKDAVN